MLFSLFADASYCPTTKTGGWGVYIVSKKGRKTGSGAFKVVVENNIEAEMLACANAIFLALKMASSGDKLLIQSDCLSGVQIFNGIPTKSKNCRAIAVLVAEWCRAKNVTTEFRHVKGHVQKGLARHWVNNHCDEAARREMRKARARVKNGYRVGELF